MSGDPISGTWTTGREFIYLRYDGKFALAGVVTSGGLNNLATVKVGTFDPTTGTMRLEGEGRHPRDGSAARFVIEGALANDRLSVTYEFGDARGDATLQRVTLWSTLQSIGNALGYLVRRLLGPPTGRRDVCIPTDVRRRTAAENEQAMRDRGETLESFKIREPEAQDIPALAELHVITWAMTYPAVAEPPTFAIRHWQWTEAFAKPNRDWFCFVIENATGALIGFAKGVRMNDRESDLNKIYLRWEYHRLGLGRLMLGRVTRRFISMGITTMYVRAEADNPSCGFYERTGAVNTIDAQTGKPHGGSYVWRDLPALSAICPD